MNVRKLRFIAIAGGFLFLFLAVNYFMQSYREGNPKWFYVIASCAMGILLFNTIFGKRR